MSEFTSLSDIVTIFYNSAQPNFVRYHIITLYFALVAPKQSIVIQLSFATTIACTLLWLPQSKVRFYPTFVRYHHRLLSCSGCPKAKYGSIRLLFATTIACCLALVAPKQSTVLSDFCSLPPSPAVLLLLPQSKVPFNLLISCFSMDPNGFAFLHNGTIFYSPNSNRHVAVPDPVDPGRYQFSENNARLDRFQHPQWWTRPSGFLAFVPLIPRFDGTVFGCLCDITAHICPCEHDGKFSLRPEKAAQWRDLEDLLIFVTSLLKTNTHFLFGPSLSPAPPSCLGYHRPRNTPRAARLQAAAGRD